MSKNQIRVISVIFGVLSFIFGCYYVHLIVSIQSIISFATLRMMMTNFVMLHFVLFSAILFVGTVSSFGIFKLMRWGRLLAIVALTSYMVNFLALITTQVLSPYFDGLIYSKRGWFIFYHMNLRIDTFVIPLFAMVFLVLFNLNVFRKNYQS